jgi:hypothetical protein
MKIAGIDPNSLSRETILVLPRGESQIVFRAKSLKDMTEFNVICPLPKAPGKLTKDGFIPNTTDATYKQVMAQWSSKRLGYMVIKTLEPTEIEWDTADINNPKTWGNWETDLKNGGLSQFECNRVTALVLEANSLDDEKLEKARSVFLAGQQQEAASCSGQVSEPANTSSGEPVNG